MTAMASTLNLKASQVYLGDELVNDSATGKHCSVTIENVDPQSATGKYCYEIRMLLSTANAIVPQQPFTLNSRVTNIDLPGYPENKTCATNLDGSVAGSAIYGDDTGVIYTQLFSGENQSGHDQYDYFLTISPTTKLASKTRVHVGGWLTETDVDCVHLELK